MVQAINLIFLVLQLAILVRVLSVSSSLRGGSREVSAGRIV